MEVNIAVWMEQADDTGVVPEARLVAASTYDEAEEVMNKAAVDTDAATEAAVVARQGAVDLLFFEPSVRLAHLSYQLSSSSCFVYWTPDIQT